MDMKNIYKSPFLILLIFLFFNNLANAQVSITESSVGNICLGKTKTLTAMANFGTSPYTYTWSPAVSLNVNNAITVIASPVINTVYTLTVKDINNITATATKSVNLHPILNASFTKVDLSCFGLNNGSFNINASGGTAPLTYSFSPTGVGFLWPGIPDSITFVAAGHYTATVTDANGCFRSSSTLINQPTPISATVAAKNAVCFGQSNGGGIITATGGTPYTNPAGDPYNYFWYTPSFSPIAYNKNVSTLAPGTYNVYVTDSNNCNIYPNLFEVVVVANPSRVNSWPSITSPVTCHGLSDAIVTVAGSGGTVGAGYTYKINSGTFNTSNTFTDLAAGINTFTVRDGNLCTRDSVFTITQPNIYNGTPTTILSNGVGTCGSNPTFVTSKSCTILNGNTWHHFVNQATDQVYMSVNPNGNNLGRVTGTIYNTAPSTISTNNDLSGFSWNYMNKVWTIESDSLPKTPVGVRFYYSPTEFNALASTTSCASCDGTDLIVSQSESIAEDCNASNNNLGNLNLYWFKNPASTVAEIAQVQLAETGAPNVTNKFANVASGLGATKSNMSAFSAKYIEVNTLGFSEWRLHLPSTSPLSNDFIFTGEKSGSSSILKWACTKEENVKQYNLLRSADGVNFTELKNISSKAINGNSSITLDYSYIDNQPYNSHNYYKLEQVKKSEQKKTSNIIDVIHGNETNITIFPNPSSNEVSIDINLDKTTNATISLVDITGRIIKQVTTGLDKGKNIRVIDLSDCANGIYYITIRNNSVLNYSYKITKQ
jgi:hypothetical protein